jgi:7,8-dihydropterin-6-yl-methyl-4-(beta-D-ribofuranosyl)aminobenzene 5'-phosphate synthase
MVARLRDQWKLERVAAGHCTGEFALSEFSRGFGLKFGHAGDGSEIPLPR